MKRTLLLLSLLLSALLLSSCFSSSADNGIFEPITGTQTRTVTFVIDGESQTRTFDAGQEIIYPTLFKKENYIFDGWYYDEEGTRPASLGSSLSSNVTLYAHWRYDYESAINSIFDTYIKAAVRINVNHKKTEFGFNVSSRKVSGSGVIFREDSKLYYAFTNYHVIESMEGYNSKEIVVYDCYGNQHYASIEAADPEYDLAILRISKGDEPLAVLPLASEEAKAGDVVVAIGTPDGLENTVTFGNVTKKAQLSKNEEAGNLGFPVIWHDAPIDHGSSGGALLNGNFEIVGINYAIGTSPSDGEFLCGLAVGIDKINEFLSKQ